MCYCTSRVPPREHDNITSLAHLFMSFDILCPSHAHVSPVLSENDSNKCHALRGGIRSFILFIEGGRPGYGRVHSCCTCWTRKLCLDLTVLLKTEVCVFEMTSSDFNGCPLWQKGY